MFRKLLRLERWIAFDGAGIADVAVFDASADGSDGDAPVAPHLSDLGDLPSDGGPVDDDGDSGAPGDFADDAPISGFDILFAPAPQQTINSLVLSFPDFPQHNGEVSLTFPVGFDRPDHFDASALPSYLPFIYDDSVVFAIDPSAATDIHVQHMFVGVTFPANGAFTLFSTSAGGVNAFVTQHQIPVGSLFAYSVGTMPSSGIYTGTVHVGRVEDAGGGALKVVDAVHVIRSYQYGDSVRFGFTEFAAPEHLQAVLRSLVYTPDTPGDDDAAAFGVSLFHDLTGTAYSVNKLIVGDDCAFVEEKSAGAIQDATQPCDESGAVIGEGPGPENPPGPTDPPPDPPTDPDPDDPEIPETPETPHPPPVDPYVPPSPPGDGDDVSGGGDWGEPSSDLPDSAWTGDSREDEDALRANSLLFRPFDDDYDEEEPGEDDAGGQAVAVARVAPVSLDGDDGPDAAWYAELLGEIELAMLGVRQIHSRLDLALNRLGAEYAHRHRSQWTTDAKQYLGDILSAGRDQKRLLDGVKASLAREIEVMRAMPPDRRDGAMELSLRDLSDSAARQTGTAAAMADALEKVAERMRDTRLAEIPAPAQDDLAGVFEEARHLAAAEWREKATLRDAMARDLEEHTLLSP